MRPGLPRLEANINLLCEVDQALHAGTSGVGLYRSEFLFLARRTLPTEDEQVGIYRKLLYLLEGRPVSIRTFDLRPDKVLHYEHLSSFANHPLDWRLVLDSPALQKLFKDQVRAILRAAACDGLPAMGSSIRTSTSSPRVHLCGRTPPTSCTLDVSPSWILPLSGL